MAAQGLPASELAALPLFGGASEAELAPLAAESERLMLPTGTILHREGDVASTLYWVESGEIGLRVDTGGRSTLVMTVRPGDLLGWAALQPMATSLTTARAMSDVRLIAMPAERFVDLLASGSPGARPILRRLFGLAAAHLDGTRRQLLRLGSEGVISAG